MNSTTSFDEYLQGVTVDQKAELERIRKIVHTVVLGAEECISYGIPTIRFQGKNLIHFAAFKNHMSIFPTAQPIEELAGKLKSYKTGRGTIQFTLDNPVPKEIIQQLVELRMKSILKG